MQWFKLYADLQHHPKRYRFEELAGTEYGLHYLTAWFGYVCRFAPNGDISAFTPREVARACEWKGDAQIFWDALLGAGFIEKTKKGYCSHDWYEENGRFIRENERRKPTGNPRKTLGKPVLQDSTGQDNTGHKKVLTPKPPSASGFDEFWTLYPKHVSKNAAFKAWTKLAPDDVLRDAIARALAWQRASVSWTKDNGQFIPYPASWLNARRWEDEKNSNGGSHASHSGNGRISGATLKGEASLSAADPLKR